MGGFRIKSNPALLDAIVFQLFGRLHHISDAATAFIVSSVSNLFVLGIGVINSVWASHSVFSLEYNLLSATKTWVLFRQMTLSLAFRLCHFMNVATPPF